jgi:hypothetical protein
MLGFLLASGLALSTTAAAADDRYTIAPLVNLSGLGPDKALILDTESGHLWLWLEDAGSEVEGGTRMLIYQGQVRPGKQMGDIIEQQEWPAKKP